MAFSRGRSQHLRTLRGHRAAVYCACFSPCGRHFVSGADDRLVKIWSARSGALLAACRGHGGDVTDLTVLGRFVLSGSNDRTVRVWSRREGSRLGTTVTVFDQHQAGVTAVQAVPLAGAPPRPPGAPPAMAALSLSEDGVVWLWDPASALCYAVLKPGPAPTLTPAPGGAVPAASAAPVRVLTASSSPCGRFVALGCSDKLVRVWHVPRDVGASEPRQGALELLEFSRRVAAGGGAGRGGNGRDGAALAERAGSRRPREVAQLEGHRDKVSSVAWSHHGRRLLTCSKDGNIRLWEPGGGPDAPSSSSGRRLFSWACRHALLCKRTEAELEAQRAKRRGGFIEALAGCWALDDARVLASFKNHKVLVFCSRSGAVLHEFQHGGAVYVLTCHPRDPLVALSAGYDGRAKVLDIGCGDVLAEFMPGRDGAGGGGEAGATPGPGPSADDEGLFQLTDGQFSPDGLGLLVSDMAGQISLYGAHARGNFLKVPYDQFFASEGHPILLDLMGYVLDVETGRPPHSRLGQDAVCDSLLESYPEPLQGVLSERRLDAVPLDEAVGLRPATPHAARLLPALLVQEQWREELGRGGRRGGAPATGVLRRALPLGEAPAPPAAAVAGQPGSPAAPVTLDDLVDWQRGGGAETTTMRTATTRSVIGVRTRPTSTTSWSMRRLTARSWTPGRARATAARRGVGRVGR